MPTNANHPAGGTWPARIVIIDDHEISRAACRALLRTEGLDVVADLAADNQPLTAARAPP
jgi:DNA-binding NarL/FixJ family response regulator